MTARFTYDPPLASAGSWPTLPPPARLAKLEKIWRENMARRDAAAKDYGEPETPHEFYAGRPGSQAEKIVCDCLRTLQKLPDTDRLYADQFASAISRIYLGGAMPEVELGTMTRMRRITQLLEIAKAEQAS